MLTQLYELSLPNNNLSRLPHSFYELKFLKRLNLDSNSFDVFPDVIKKMQTLSHLSFDANNFPEEEKERIQREYNIWVS
jgi:Leucine-rich repeat (LRR) protein